MERGGNMVPVVNHEELVRRALKYIVEKKQDDDSVSITELLDDAGSRFNLSPLDQEALLRLFLSVKGGAVQ